MVAMPRTPDPTDPVDPAIRLRNTGLRVTAPRMAVLRYLDGESHAAADALGYTVDEAEVTYWGECPRCQDAVDTTSTEHLSTVPSLLEEQSR